MTSVPTFTLRVDRHRCEGAADCVRVCPTRVFRLGKPPTGLSLVTRLMVAIHGGRQAVVHDEAACTGCLQCVSACPEQAITVADGASDVTASSRTAWGGNA